MPIRASVTTTHLDDGLGLSDALEQVVDDIRLMRMRPDSDGLAAFRRGQRTLATSRAPSSTGTQALMADAAGAVPSAELIVLEGPDPGAVYRLRPENVLGRTRSADIPLPDASVSRRHACIVAAGNAFWVLDLGSSNSTFVNGERIDRHELRDGDRIDVGRWKMRYRLAE